MSRNKRGRKYIDKKVQGILIRRLMTHWVVFVIAVSVVSVILQVLFNPFADFEQQLMQIRNMLVTFLAVSIVVLPLFINDTIKLSHRFVGPVMRFRVAIREVAEGKQARPIVLRAGDFWNDFADELNAVLMRVPPLPLEGSATDVSTDDKEPTLHSVG